MSNYAKCLTAMVNWYKTKPEFSASFIEASKENLKLTYKIAKKSASHHMDKKVCDEWAEYIFSSTGNVVQLIHKMTVSQYLLFQAANTAWNEANGGIIKPSVNPKDGEVIIQPDYKPSEKSRIIH